MIPVTTYEGDQVAVLGLGRSGLVTARAIRAGGGVPVCWDDNEDALSKAEAEGFLIANLHNEQTWRDHDFKALILSPGIPHLYPAPNPVVRLAWRFKAPVDNDISLFFDNVRHSALVQTVCITGSNGKSTTTALIHHILRQAGRNTQMGGNIGRGALDLDPPVEDQVYVLELSSYQTELALVLAPSIAVFLNFSPDHYDRHGGRGGYFAAKARLFEYGRPLQAIIGVEQDEGRFLANHYLADREEGFGLGGAITMLGGGEGDASRGHVITVRDSLLLEQQDGEHLNIVELGELPALKGAHNHQNACAAYAVCRELGLEVDEIRAGLKSFTGLPHRMEQVGRLKNVLFVNDSKATNVDSAVRALASYKNIFWIVGGQAKEGGFDELKAHLGNVERAYLVGESAQQFSGLLGDDIPHDTMGTLERAFDQARRDALDLEAGEAVVLLSPACASFDQFKSFEHRGDAFRALVHGVDGVEKLSAGDMEL